MRGVAAWAEAGRTLRVRSRISAIFRGSGSILIPPIMDLGFLLPGETVHPLGAEDMIVRLDGCVLSITCRERKTVIAPHPAPRSARKT